MSRILETVKTANVKMEGRSVLYKFSLRFYSLETVNQAKFWDVYDSFKRYQIFHRIKESLHHNYAPFNIEFSVKRFVAKKETVGMSTVVS